MTKLFLNIQNVLATSISLQSLIFSIKIECFVSNGPTGKIHFNVQRETPLKWYNRAILLSKTLEQMYNYFY